MAQALPFPENTLTPKQKRFFRATIEAMMKRSDTDSLGNPIITVSAALKSVWKHVDMLC